MNVAVARVVIESLEGLESAIGSGTIEPTQLSSRTPKGCVFAAELGDSLLTYGRTDADYSVTGVFSPDSLSFGLFLGSDESQVWSSDCIPGDFGVFPACTEHAAHHRGNLEYLVMTVDPIRLSNLADAEGISLDRKFLACPRMYRPGKDWAAFSIAYAKGICSTLAELDPLIGGASSAAGRARRIMADDLTRLFLHGCAQSNLAAIDAEPDCQLGQRLVREAHHFLLGNMDNPPTVDLLASRLSVSRRTLYRAFKSQLGMPPAKYLKLYRQSRVHLELRHSRPKETSVSACALRWGFAELGRFAGEYRQLFGELPSETIAKQRASRYGRLRAM